MQSLPPFPSRTAKMQRDTLSGHSERRGFGSERFSHRSRRTFFSFGDFLCFCYAVVTLNLAKGGDASGPHKPRIGLGQVEKALNFAMDVVSCEALA